MSHLRALSGVEGRACKVLAHRREQVVHVPECLLRYQSPDRGHPGSPPGDSREAVLRSNQGDRVAVDSCCRDRLGLPGLQLHRVTGVDKVLGVNVLEVIEASAATYLEPGEPQDESVQHLVSALSRNLLRVGAGGIEAIVSGPLLQSPYDLFAGDHRLTLRPGDRVRERLLQ